MGLELLLIAGVSLIVGILSGVVGGGGGLVLIPFLLILDYEPSIIVGTIKLTALGLVFGSLTNFKGTKYIIKKDLKFLIPVAIIATLVGPFITLNVSERLLEVMMIASLLIIAIVMLLKPDLGLDQLKSKKITAHRNLGVFMYMVITLLQTAFSSGMGALVDLVYIGLLGYSMLETMATKRYVGFFFVPLQVVIFGYLGLIDIKLGAILFITALIGARIGSKIAMKKGNLFVRRLFLATTILTAIYLII